MDKPELLAALAFDLGPVRVGPTVLTTWLLMVVLVGIAWLGTRRLTMNGPSRFQSALEGAVVAVRGAIEATAPGFAPPLLPFIGTLWIFVGAANLTGLLPGLKSPTADLSLTVALAVLVFLSVHWYGLRLEGPGAYLRHYLYPNPILLPFHVMGEVTRTVALSVRLFGNMMSLEMAAFLVLLVAGLLVPVPVLLLHVVEAVVQAYIFGMLALIYVAGGLQSRELARRGTP
jgi:F-type H+-transporting ATPase subunit a